MEFIRLSGKYLEALKFLQTEYKYEIGEDAPNEEDFGSLFRAIEDEKILFYGCVEQGELIACCSVCPTYSTFDYQKGGVFEDFYIVPAYRHKGIAGRLVRFAYQESGVSSLTVGCADCDLEMYKALGFNIPLGNMLAFEG